MYDVHYLNDDVNSRFQGKATGPLPIKMEAVLLPQSRGYGEMPALHIALSNDENLLSLVKSFVSLKPYEMGLMSSMLEEIMYQWAGVSEVDPDKFNTGERTSHLLLSAA